MALSDFTTDRRFGGFARKGLSQYAGGGRISTAGDYDLSTSEGLLNLARDQGGAVAGIAEELVHPEKSMLSWASDNFKRLFGTFIDTISLPSQVVAGIISPDLSIGEAISSKTRPSAVLFGEPNPDDTTLQKVGNWFIRTGTDILLDPVTYVTFGAGQGIFGISAAVKIPITTAAGERVLKALNPKGKELLIKGIDLQRRGLLNTAVKTGKADGLEEGSEAMKVLIKNTLDANLDREFVKETLGKLITTDPKFAQLYLDKGGIKFFGQTILAGQRISSALRLIPHDITLPKAISEIPKGKAAAGLEEAADIFKQTVAPIRNTMHALFSTAGDVQFGKLPEEFSIIEQRAKDLVEARKISDFAKWKDVAGAFKLTIQESRFLFDAIEANKIPVDPRLADAWKKIKDLNAFELRRLRTAGFAVMEEPNHVPHVLVSQPVRTLPFTTPPTRTTGATLQRKLDDTLANLEEKGVDVSQFDRNVVSAELKRSLENSQAIVMNDFIKELGEKFGVSISKAPQGYRTAAITGLKNERLDFSKWLLSKEGDELAFHPAIAKRIENFIGSVINDEPTAKALEAFDAVQGIWKASVTSIFPAFHGRNAVSNVLLHFLDIGVHSLNPANHIMSFELIKNDRLAERLQREMLVKGPAGEKAKAEFYDLMTKTVLTDRTGYTWSFGELRNVIRDKQVAFSPRITGAVDIRTERGLEINLFEQESRGAKILRRIMPTTQEFAPFAAGREFGRAVEEQARLVDFLVNLKDTGDVTHAAMRTKMFLFDYQNLTGFERTFLRRLIPFYCVPEDSLALTKTGWKHYSQIKKGEELLTYSNDKDEYEWQPCLEIASFDHDEELMVIENTRHKIRFTPEHRWITERIPSTTIHPYGIYHYPYSRTIKKGYELTTQDNIKVVSEFKGQKSQYTNEDARLLGWLLTDGCFRARGNHIEAMIYQSPKKFLSEVKLVAGGKPRKPHPQTGVVCVPVLIERIERIKHLLKRNKSTEDWCDFIASLSRDGLEAIYDAMYKADGTTVAWRHQDFFACQLDGVGRTFEMTALLLGKRTVKSVRGYYVSRNTRLKVGKTKMEHYSGIVWCPKTANGTWVMQQGNLITISGNTFTRKNLETQIRALVTTPGKVAMEATALTSIGDVLSGTKLTEEEEKALPKWIKTGIFMLSSKRGETVELLQSLGTPLEQPFQQFQANQFMGSISPLLRVPIEQASGYSFFQGKALSDVTNASAFIHAPEFVKDFIGFSEIKGKRSDGRPFTWYVSLRPERMNLLLNMPPTSRVLSSLKQMEAVDVSGQAKILQFLIGIRPFSFDLEQEAQKRERELKSKIEATLNTARVTASFKRTFIPREQ